LQTRGFQLFLIVAALASCGKIRDDTPQFRSIDALTSALSVSPAFELDGITTSPDGLTGAGYSSIASGNGQYLVAFERGFCFSVVRVTSSGQPVEPGGLCVGPPVTSGRQSDIVWDGQQWLVVWQDSALYAVRVTANGEVVDNPPLGLASNADYETGPGVAFNGERSLVVWGAPFTLKGNAAVHGMWKFPDGGRSAPFL
jgi:hypothetical protein